MWYSAGANYPDYLIGVQSVVVDPIDRLWILDTGRVFTPDGKTLVQSSVSYESITLPKWTTYTRADTYTSTADPSSLELISRRTKYSRLFYFHRYAKSYSKRKITFFSKSRLKSAMQINQRTVLTSSRPWHSPTPISTMCGSISVRASPQPERESHT